MANPSTLRKVTGQGDVYWEDLSVGDRVTGPGITVAESHLVAWAGLTGDWVSLHLDHEYAVAQGYDGRIAHGPFTLSTALGLMTQTGVFGNVRAWLGVDAVRALSPVMIGDTLHPEAEVTLSRATKRPDLGIWTLAYSMLNQRDEVVMTFTSSFMIVRRDTDPDSQNGTIPQ